MPPFLDRLRAWRERSVNRRILAASVMVAGFTALWKLAAFGQEALAASLFGTTDARDAFIVAYALADFALRVVATPFGTALQPTYIRVRQERGREEADRLMGTVLTIATLFLSLVAVALLGLIGPVLQALYPAFGPEKLELSRQLLILLLPLLVITGLSSLWSAVLNAGERFALTAAVPIARPLVVVGFLLAVGSTWGVHALAIGFVAGSVLETLALAVGLRRRGIPIRPRWSGLDDDVRTVLRQCAPLIWVTVLGASAGIVDRTMAASLQAGSVSALDYGTKIVSAVVSLGSVGLSMSLLPYFSRMVAQEDWNGLRHVVRTWTRLILLKAVPAAVVLAVLSRPLVGLLFERGAFTAEDGDLVSKVQVFYLFQLPGYLLNVLFVGLCQARRRNHWLIWISGLNLIVNVVGNLVLMRVMGVAGIAASTAIVYTLSAALTGWAAVGRLPREAT